jgi:hypothetical protein
MEGNCHGIICLVLSQPLLGKAEENHKKISGSPGPYFNTEPPEFEAGLVSTRWQLCKSFGLHDLKGRTDRQHTGVSVPYSLRKE